MITDRPMINLGEEIYFSDKDGWTNFERKMAKPSAHYEHTVV